MISISCNLARQIASIFRKALALSNHQFTNQLVRLEAGPQGLRIQSATAQCAVAYYETTPIVPCILQAPLEMFKTVGGTKSDLVSLVETDDGKIQARWQDGAVPRQGQWNCRDERPLHDMPTVPTSFTDNPPEFLAAIREAVATTDSNPTRFALNCLRLRGSDGSVAATDGRQVFKHSGFEFGFYDEVLFYPAQVLDTKDLPMNAAVSIGRTDTHVVINIGPWSFFQGIEKDRRFPRIEDVIPHLVGSSTLRLQKNDAAFLEDSLHRLPAMGDNNQPVTVDLNGRVAIRAQATEDAQPTELVLSNSVREGVEICLATDRRYLARAAKMGFDCIHFPDNKTPAVCDDGRRTYVWALLSTEGMVAATENATVIKSSLSTAIAKDHPRPATSAKQSLSISETSTTMKRQPHPPRSEQPREPVQTTPVTTTGPIEHAIALRNQLRDMLTNTNGLIRSLKRQKQQQRLMQSTLQSLKQLQAVG